MEEREEKRYVAILEWILDKHSTVFVQSGCVKTGWMGNKWMVGFASEGDGCISAVGAPRERRDESCTAHDRYKNQVIVEWKASLRHTAIANNCYNST